LHLAVRGDLAHPARRQDRTELYDDLEARDNELKGNTMANHRKTTENEKSPRWYRGADIPMRVIRQFARDVAESFHPEKIILFGSYAHGRPHKDSDVDILVVMLTRNQLDQAFKIHWKIQPPFPLHIIVRTPKKMEWRLAEGDSFLGEVVSKGKVLYEARHKGMGEKGRSRSRYRTTDQPK
jgi:predicted nucleotidyltransferase